MEDYPSLPQIFAVDFEHEAVILFDGTAWPVETWYDPLAQECTPDRAMACVFQGPFNLWFAVDIRTVHRPDIIN